MNLPNGSTADPSTGVAKDVGELTHDIVSLVELQFELFRNDCRGGLKGLLLPLALLLIAGMVAVGTASVTLLLLAEFLVQAAGLSRAVALAGAALSGFLGAVALAIVGWSQLRGVGRVFRRSREELARNLTWIKNSLKRPTPLGPPPPQDR